jgi:hypothetical protein
VRPMESLPAIASGFVRITVRLAGASGLTPGELARATGVPPDHIGPVAVHSDEGVVDVRAELGKQARERLERLGATRLVGWEWQWLKLHVGRNHGLSMGQLRKIMQTVDAMPLGRIAVNNTHTLVGLQDFKIPPVLARLAVLKINGFAARPEVLPLGKGPGSAAYVPPR